MHRLLSYQHAKNADGQMAFQLDIVDYFFIEWQIQQLTEKFKQFIKLKLLEAN